MQIKINTKTDLINEIGPNGASGSTTEGNAGKAAPTTDNSVVLGARACDVSCWFTCLVLHSSLPCFVCLLW